MELKDILFSVFIAIFAILNLILKKSSLNKKIKENTWKPLFLIPKEEFSKVGNLIRIITYIIGIILICLLLYQML